MSAQGPHSSRMILQDIEDIMLPSNYSNATESISKDPDIFPVMLPTLTQQILSDPLYQSLPPTWKYHVMRDALAEFAPNVDLCRALESELYRLVPQISYDFSVPQQVQAYIHGDLDPRTILADPTYLNKSRIDKYNHMKQAVLDFPNVRAYQRELNDLSDCMAYSGEIMMVTPLKIREEGDEDPENVDDEAPENARDELNIAKVMARVREQAQDASLLNEQKVLNGAEYERYQFYDSLPELERIQIIKNALGKSQAIGLTEPEKESLRRRKQIMQDSIVERRGVLGKSADILCNLEQKDPDQVSMFFTEQSPIDQQKFDKLLANEDFWKLSSENRSGIIRRACLQRPENKVYGPKWLQSATEIAELASRSQNRSVFETDITDPAFAFKDSQLNERERKVLSENGYEMTEIEVGDSSVRAWPEIDLLGEKVLIWRRQRSFNTYMSANGQVRRLSDSSDRSCFSDDEISELSKSEIKNAVAPGGQVLQPIFAGNESESSQEAPGVSDWRRQVQTQSEIEYVGELSGKSKEQMIEKFIQIKNATKSIIDDLENVSQADQRRRLVVRDLKAKNRDLIEKQELAESTAITIAYFERGIGFLAYAAKELVLDRNGEIVEYEDVEPVNEVDRTLDRSRWNQLAYGAEPPKMSVVKELKIMIESLANQFRGLKLVVNQYPYSQMQMILELEVLIRKISFDIEILKTKTNLARSEGKLPNVIRSAEAIRLENIKIYGRRP